MRARSSVAERSPDTGEVAGAEPAGPTITPVESAVKREARIFVNRAMAAFGQTLTPDEHEAVIAKVMAALPRGIRSRHRKNIHQEPRRAGDAP